MTTIEVEIRADKRRNLKQELIRAVAGGDDTAATELRLLLKNRQRTPRLV
jgi:hypothetical protein